MKVTGSGGVSVNMASKVGDSHRSVTDHVTVTVPPVQSCGMVDPSQSFVICGSHPPDTEA